MRIVLVDPSRTVLKCVARLLEARGHDVRGFTDGREALACIAADPAVGAVITSAELISMSGLELCWETRLLTGPHRAIYIILMSSNRDAHNLGEALDSGADDFIGKPPVADELYARLRAAERIATMQGELIRLATTDPLTGLLNRRAFFERAEDACARTARGGGPLAAVMLDIDHFKHINDSHGHDTGDVVLRRVATEAREAIDGCGSVGRLGGEEFAAVIEGLPLAQATAVAEGVRLRIASLRFAVPGGELTLTCSFGVAARAAGEAIDHLLKRADVALYAAKSGGRNRVVTADPTAAPAADAPSGLVRTAIRPRLAAALP